MGLTTECSASRISQNRKKQIRTDNCTQYENDAVKCVNCFTWPRDNDADEGNDQE